MMSECAFPHLGKRGAGSRKSAFWQADSRKSAVWPAPPEHTSRKSALWPRPRGAPHQKTHSGWGVTSRMRLSVTSNPQNALFRKMRFFSPAQTWRRLTEKRILAGRLTEKRTLATATSRKSALWPRPRDVPHGKAHSGWGVTFRMRFYVRCLTKRRTLAVLELAECVFT